MDLSWFESVLRWLGALVSFDQKIINDHTVSRNRNLRHSQTHEAPKNPIVLVLINFDQLEVISEFWLKLIDDRTVSRIRNLLYG